MTWPYMLNTMKRKRRCRFCGKVIRNGNYFFCDRECQDKFLDIHIPQEAIDKINLIAEQQPKPHILASQCKRCRYDCKVFVEVGTPADSYRIYCDKTGFKERD